MVAKNLSENYYETRENRIIKIPSRYFFQLYDSLSGRNEENHVSCIMCKFNDSYYHIKDNCRYLCTGMFK